MTGIEIGIETRIETGIEERVGTALRSAMDLLDINVRDVQSQTLQVVILVVTIEAAGIVIAIAIVAEVRMIIVTAVIRTPMMMADVIPMKKRIGGTDTLDGDDQGDASPFPLPQRIQDAARRVQEKAAVIDQEKAIEDQSDVIRARDQIETTSSASSHQWTLNHLERECL